MQKFFLHTKQNFFVVFPFEPCSKEIALYRMGRQSMDRRVARNEWQLSNRTSDTFGFEIYAAYVDPCVAFEG